MAQKVRVGVIGTSRHTEGNHLAYLRSHPQAEIVALCGRNQERAAEVARRNGIPRIFADYRVMIEQGGLDAVVVSTPDDTHYAMTMAALDAGLHVMCEKPLALTAVQAREMYEKAEAVGVVHMTFLNWRWVPHFRQIRELIAQGFVGQPFSLSMRWWMGYGRTPGYRWRNDPSHSMGALGDLGSHMIDLARLYMGEITQVAAHHKAYRAYQGPDGSPMEPSNDTASLLVEFAGGAQGTMQFSYIAYKGENLFGDIETVIHGSEGTLEVNYDPQKAELKGFREGDLQPRSLPVDPRFYGGTDPAQSIDERFSSLFLSEPIGDRLFIDAILGMRQPDATFYDGWKVQQVIDAALESYRCGEWMKLE